MASYYNQVSSLNPEIWYRLNETAGTPINSGSVSNSVTATGTPLLNEPTDVDGRSVYFNGTSRFNMSQMPRFTIFDDRVFTVECWFKTTQALADTQYELPLWSLRGRTTSSGTTGNIALFYLQVGGDNPYNQTDKYKLTFYPLINTWQNEKITTTQNVTDGQWHHAVVTFNTTNFKLYLDGQLIQTLTNQGGASQYYIDDSASHASSSQNEKRFGNGFKGWLDEFAVYDYELSAQQVLDNYNAGASVEFADAPGTASSLIVHPSLTTDGVHLAAPMTASSVSGDHYVSNFNIVKHVDTYLSELSLEQWYKFDKLEKITNYGSGGTIADTAWAFNGNTTTLPQGGIQGSGALQMQGAQGHQVQLAFGVTEPLSTEITDNEFTFGFWFKGEAGFKDKSVDLIRYYNPFGADKYYLRVRAGTGYVEFGRQGSLTHTAVHNTDVTDGNWHFIQAKGSHSNNYIKVNVDNGTEVSTTTSGTAPAGLSTALFNGATITGTNTAKAWMSHYFVAPIANVGSTEVTNLLSYDDLVIQATAMFPEPLIRFENKFNDKIQTFNPKMEFRLDESDGSPINFGTIDTISIAKTGTAVTYLQPTQNRFAYKFTNANTYFQGDWTTATGTFTTNAEQTMSIVFKSNGYTTWDQILGSSGMLGFLGTGITIRILANNGHLQAKLNRGFGPTDTETLTFTTNVADNKWHHVVAVKDGSNFSLYLDGSRKARITNSAITPADSGTWAINGEGKYDGTSGTKELYIDEFALLAAGLSDQEVLELFHSLNIFDGAMIANNATLPMPTNIAGTGATYNSGSLDASALFAVAQESAEAILAADPMTSSSTFVHPNYVAGQLIDVNYGAETALADALFHDAQFQIGEIHSADHMDASALFVHPISTGGGKITVSTAVGGPAELVMPGIVTIKGAQVFAEVLSANAIFPLPPAYVQLTDDDWFVKLLAGHAERVIEPIQATLGSLPNQATTDVAKGGFLSFFDDLLADRTTTTTPNSISSEIPAFYFTPVDSYSYDANGNILPLDTSKAIARLSNSRGSSSPAPILGSGIYDPYQRKAARVNNIEIPLPGTDPKFSERPYNIEFSIKTTKVDQILAYGYKTSTSGYSRVVGAVGLFDGKIYLTEDRGIPFTLTGPGIRGLLPTSAPHPKKFVDRAQYLLGRTNIADGQWHHVIIQQGWSDGRTQIWVDGQLDRQVGVLNELGGTGYSSFPGSDGTNTIRPYIIGFNSDDRLLYSDFETSGWNFYPARFITEDKILENFAAYSKWKPVKAEPMTATVRMTDNNAGKGNRPRALLLYWWPKTGVLGNVEGSVGLGTIDNGKYGVFDETTFPLLTLDTKETGPQQYYGWDIFPIDVIGRNPSDMIKPNIWSGYGYRDNITGSPRYLDLMNDIDISKFDAIFFKNYPEQTEELDEYVREELSDTYFNIKEKTLHENFLKSLRAAVDTGISLFITNAQLAIDLGIIDRVEEVSDLCENDFDDTDDFVQNRLSGTSISQSGTYVDTWRNNRLRIVNTFEDITNYPTYLWRDWMYFKNTDELDFGGANRPYISLLDRPNGLQVGDEFIISDANRQPTLYQAVPFENVKAGIIIAAFSNQVRRSDTLSDNPYRNYATCIALPAGTILNGKATGGKIFVNFTERIEPSSTRGTYGSRDTHSVELIQDKWINLAYADGSITLEKKNELLAASYNLDRQLEAAIADGNQTAINNINKLKYWDLNGQNILSNKALVDDPTGGGVEKDGLGDGVRKSIVNKVSRKGVVSTRSVSTTAQWFQLTYAYAYPLMQVKAPSLLSNGFSWLADKIVDEGNVNRVQVMTAIATEMPMPVVTADKDRTVYASAMLANATIIHAPGYALADVSNTTLPLTASAVFGEFVKNIKPDIFTASILIREPRISGVEEDEVVVYMIHVDPILYLREDIIK